MSLGLLFLLYVGKKVSVKNRKGNLTFDEKIKVLEILVSHNFEIDFSGGDPLLNPEDFSIVERATEIMPKNSIDISMTGVNFNKKKLDLLKKVRKVEISMDNIPVKPNIFRPDGFSTSAINLLRILVREDILCTAVTTLYPLSANKKNLEELYRFLCDNKIPIWNILRFYPVGRGLKLSDLHINDKEILDLLNFLDSLRGGYTKIVFQHSLKMLRGEYQCDAVVESVGILPNGIVTACGWGLDGNSNPLPGFYLGRLPEDNLDFIFEKAKKNMGYNKKQSYCRILNYLKNQGVVWISKK